jgi:integral membrane protein
MGMDARLRQCERLRRAALWEGATLLLLLGLAVPLKHLAGQAGMVTLMGPLHGMAFLYYLWTIASNVTGEDWTRTEVAQLIGCAMLPFGACFSVRLIGRKTAAMAAPAA